MWLLTTPVSGCVKMFRAHTVASEAGLGTRYTMVSTWCPPPPGPCLTDGHIMVAANRDNYHHKTKNIPPTQSQSQNRNYFVSVRLSSRHDKLHVISTSPHPITTVTLVTTHQDIAKYSIMFVCVPHLTLCLSLNIWFNLTSNPSPAVWPGLGDMTTSQYCL